MKVIGAVGQNGSGKDEVVKYLNTRYGVPLLSTGDMVRDIAAREKVKPTRDNLQIISDRYFRQFGRGCFVRLIADRIRTNGWRVAAISGIRSPDDVSILRDSFGQDFVLIYVYVTDPRERYARLSRRGESRDENTYEEFLQQDRAEEELFHIKKSASQADYSLSNDGKLDELHLAIDRLIAEKKLLEGLDIT